ncbi:MAG: bifunctional folylpolyglutamate synthase/dihydrofolate synthase [Bacteroidia bacterium]|nr:bifunctional folylpolyglutamate synthase/dihydrofolate synthase [Bacteroidia bacterium]MCX7652229.1 bifunctional folylpolyglutamate synthase/dihydrofolate synthase [Bacteroidia bacterium]MDW8416491.1 folylpolyglutamate synthase/dihydrofolate synthase family protein [Bacteroidia bacterium]
MTIESWEAWLYARLQTYERGQRKALHPTLDFIRRWDMLLGHPHQKYPIIHIAGTNGKGSTSAYLAAILQAAGYRVGLHTSPHLWRFTERMRVNGQEPPAEWVDAFLSRWKGTIEQLRLSFFEVTVGMSLAYFAEAEVDIAIVEVGLGGLWDATNIVSPLIAVITPISWDHVEILGPTIEDIARQKGGIIKSGRPVIVSSQDYPEAFQVIAQIAEQQNAPLIQAEYHLTAGEWVRQEHTYHRIFTDKQSGKNYLSDLTGDYQSVNLATVLTAVEQLRRMGWRITEEGLREGIASVSKFGLLYGRGQWLLQNKHTLLLDVAHNPQGLAAVRRLVESAPVPMEGLIIGFSQDKDIPRALEALGGWTGPVFFTAAPNPRACSPDRLRQIAEPLGYKGKAFARPEEALKAASVACQNILVTGSIFLVADVLAATHALS